VSAVGPSAVQLASLICTSSYSRGVVGTTRSPSRSGEASGTACARTRCSGSSGSCGGRRVPLTGRPPSVLWTTSGCVLVHTRNEDPSHALSVRRSDRDDAEVPTRARIRRDLLMLAMDLRTAPRLDDVIGEVERLRRLPLPHGRLRRARRPTLRRSGAATSVPRPRRRLQGRRSPSHATSIDVYAPRVAPAFMLELGHCRRRCHPGRPPSAGPVRLGLCMVTFIRSRAERRAALARPAPRAARAARRQAPNSRNLNECTDRPTTVAAAAVRSPSHATSRSASRSRSPSDASASSAGRSIPR
jgi:hypothetical protein